jgi:5-methylcytosine-specific restriction endonuclease McrA
LTIKSKRIAALTGITKGDLFNRRKNYQSARSTIRDHAYQVFQETNPGSCHICGYSKHIEVAHLKAVSEFTADTLITEINNQANLVGLCPNCHWEFDHSITTLQDLKRANNDLGKPHL